MEPQHGNQTTRGKLPARRNQNLKHRKGNKRHQEKISGGNAKDQRVFRLCIKYGAETRWLCFSLRGTWFTKKVIQGQKQ